MCMDINLEFLVMQLAHDSQVKHTFNYGAALRWDGFVLLFHLLCDKKDLQVCWGEPPCVSAMLELQVAYYQTLFPHSLSAL